jgi:hypothetical protein
MKIMLNDMLKRRVVRFLIANVSDLCAITFLLQIFGNGEISADLKPHRGGI